MPYSSIAFRMENDFLNVFRKNLCGLFRVRPSGYVPFRNL